MAKKDTPTLGIATLLKPRQDRASDRRVWSIPLHGIWLPFFTATNTAGETAIAPDVLGAPLRLAKEKDGTPRFSQSGRPVVRVVKELSDQIRIIRENFAFGLMSYADSVAKAMPEAYKAQVQAAQKAGYPIVQKDADDLMAYLDTLKATTPEPEKDTITPEPEKELVPA